MTYYVSFASHTLNFHQLINAFPDGLANILIWGYAEPALGMLVGNIATLRPLFQRMLHLGSSHSEDPRSKDPPGRISQPHRSHPYRDLEFELGTVADKRDDGLTSIQIHGGRESISSDNESQKQILENSDRLLERNKESIIVSQQVEINRS